MKSLFSLVCCVFYVCIIHAQHQLSALVFSADKIPVEFASVSLYPLSDSSDISGQITNSKGYFKFDNLQVGTYQLTVQMLGYEDWSQQISISQNLDLAQIILQEESLLLQGVEVVARQSVVESHLGKKVLRIGQDLSSTGSNALEALENIPSITTTPKGQIQIRGNTNVIIYINGKETKRDPSTLKFISAESLEKIEVVTNPSAKYDAEGVAGIINLVYKKDKTGSFKLETVLGLGVLTNPSFLSPSAGINASLNKDKISFFTNVSLDYGRYEDKVNAKRINFEDDLQLYENRTIQEGIGLIGNINLGISIEPDTTLSMGLELNYDRWDLLNDIYQKNIFDYRNTVDQTIDLTNQRGELENELWLNYSLEKNISSEQVLKISLTAGGEDESNFTQSDDLDDSALPENAQQFLKSSEETEQQRYYQAKVDYEVPFFKWGTIEAGLKADFIEYNILQKIALRSNSTVLADNDFSMDMQKLGIYVLQNHQIKQLEYSLGLRLEQFSSEALQRADQSVFTQKYARLFPSVQLNYLLPDHEHTLGVNYTRRINRPGFFSLNPFVSYEDPLNLETGNPALRPEIADLYEVNYHRSLDQLSIDLTLYNRNTSDAIQSIITSIGHNRTLANSTNIGKESSQGIETQLEYRFSKAFKTTATFVVGQNAFTDVENEISYNKQISWSTRLRQRIQLKNDWKIELTETYRAPQYQIQEKVHEVFYMNLAVSKKFNNKRGSISLAVRDIFNTRQYVYSLRTTEFEVERSYKWQTRQLHLGLRYTIFNGKN